MKLFSDKESGQGIIEYALILILVGVIIFVILTLLGPAISKFIQDLVAPI
ncbi:MAG: pilus assembly protein [Chloroflexi bacterium]|jgi:Flp pilus assembly pilin Flp|nr:pilus assembly protein [Chloroflexota bacterium]